MNTSSLYDTMFIIGKMISEAENNCMQNTCMIIGWSIETYDWNTKNANMGSSTIHLHGVDMTYVILKFTIKAYFCMTCNA